MQTGNFSRFPTQETVGITNTVFTPKTACYPMKNKTCKQGFLSSFLTIKYQHALLPFLIQNSMLSIKNITHTNWKFFQISKQEIVAHKSSILYINSIGSTYTKITVSGIQKCPENTPHFVPNCFEPAPMLGLSTMAIKWPLNKDIPSRKRTYFFAFFLSSPFLLSFFSFLPLYSMN